MDQPVNRSRRWSRARWGSALGLSVALVAGLVASGCGRDRSIRASGDLRVVATTTVLGDVVDQIVKCAGGKSTTLMPIGVDPHEFAPSSADLTRMVRADLVVANGLGLEAGLADAIANAEHDGARVLEVGDRIDPIRFSEPGGAEVDPETEHEADGHQHGSLDPHFWHDVARMARAARLIAGELGPLTDQPEEYQRCGSKIADQLTALDAEVRTTLAKVPAERRVLVTDHHAFGYFAAAYQFRISGVVIPGGSTMGQPSSGDLAELVGAIKRDQVRAIFSNVALPADLATTVAQEVGGEVAVVPLFVGSLGKEGSGARTYQDMMRTNAARVAKALSA